MFNNYPNNYYPSVSDIAAVTGNGFGNMDGSMWILIILFALMGGFGRGAWGGNCAGNGFTSAEIQRGFDNQSVMNKLNGIEQGLCSLGYDQLNQMNGINNTVMQTGFNLQNTMQQNMIANMQNMNALTRQLDGCCCDNKSAIAQVRYDMANDTCAITNAIQNATRDITENANANYRALHDEFVQYQRDCDKAKIAEQASMIQALNLAQSQANQNQYLLDRLNPCPIPSYPVCPPNTAYNTNPYWNPYNCQNGR